MFRAETTPGARVNWTAALPQKNRALLRGGFSLAAVLADFLAILATGVLANLTYARGVDVAADTHIRLGILVAVLFTFMSAIRDEYAIAKYLSFDNQVQRCVLPWGMTILGTLVVILPARPLTGSLALALLTYFVGGFCAMNLSRLLLTFILRAHAGKGALAARRIFLVGYEEEIETFTTRHGPWFFGIEIVAACVLRGEECLKEDLALALASARILEPDDVFVLVPWAQDQVIDTAIQAFLRIPASIHLGSDGVLDQYSNARISKIGHASCLNLVRDPLSPSEILAKRAFDIVFAALGLILLTPFLALVALAIKLDSPGPILFRQRRYGFNQQPFRLLKFRSMHVLEDDAKLTLVSENDARLTRIGRLIRRYNVDELPQLINVLRGEMSLVGPRPHALAIDQMYERHIALYARRHNVKPGITGWAQVNGFRGGMGHERMRARVEHDLYYIDHWSLWLDIEILWLTLTSEKAYANAF